MALKKIQQWVLDIIRKVKKPTNTSQTSEITEHNIYVLFSDLYIRKQLQDLRIRIKQNEEADAGKLTPAQVEKLCKLKRLLHLSQYDI